MDFRFSKAMVAPLRGRCYDACDHRGFLSMNEIARRLALLEPAERIAWNGYIIMFDMRMIGDVFHMSATKGSMNNISKSELHHV